MAENEVPQFTEDDFFKYANEHYSQTLGREIKSIDDFVTTKEVEKEVLKEIQTVPDYLKGYDEYYKATNGRSMADYVNAQKDWSAESEDSRVAEYMRRTKPHYDKDDIAYKIEELKAKMKPSEDDDLDDVASRSRIKGATLEWKDLVSESTSFLNSESEKFKSKVPDNTKMVNEGMELFKKQFSNAVNETESLKFGDLEYKYSKDDLKGIESLEDITKVLIGDGSDMKKTLQNLVFALKGEQILKDYLETGIVKHEDERLKSINNAKEQGLHNQEPTGNEAEFWAKLRK